MSENSEKEQTSFSSSSNELELKEEKTEKSEENNEKMTKEIGAGDAKSHIDDEELDALLDEALKDFDKPLPKPKMPTSNSLGAAGEANNLGFKPDEVNQEWSEEFIKAATAEFEQKMREYISQGPQSSQISSNLNKVVEAATSAALGEDKEFAASLNETFKNITAGNPDFLNNPSIDDSDLNNLISSFGMANLEESEMDEILPFMSNMMQKLMSKELLFPVLSDIVTKYPDWLETRKDSLSAEEFQKYSNQYQHMKQICEEYSNEKPADSDAIKQKRFDKISELMLKVQCSGHPPKELIGDLDEGLPSFDPSTFKDQCSIM